MANSQLIYDEPVEQIVVLFKALADPNRLCILDLLIQGSFCNCELNDRLGLPVNLLSHHLRILRKAGLISRRRDALDGRWIYYTADRDTVIRWRDWLSRFLDPARLQTRVALCGPEGQQADAVDPTCLPVKPPTK